MDPFLDNDGSSGGPQIITTDLYLLASLESKTFHLSILQPKYNISHISPNYVGKNTVPSYNLQLLRSRNKI